MLARQIKENTSDKEPTRFGSGWLSGVLSVFFGFLAFGGVLCLHFPQFLSSPDFRVHYQMHIVRFVIQSLTVGAILFGGISSILRKKKILALSGLLLALSATALGGSSVQINETLTADGPFISLDWFLIDLFLMAMIFVPLERFWPQYPEQKTFRKHWKLDIVYFMSSHLPMQIVSFLVLLPAVKVAEYIGIPVIQNTILQLPWALQFFLAILVADFSEYFIHLVMHKVPLLWRFHSIHHSSEQLDWIAGQRSHFIDNTIIHGFILASLMFGFSQSIILAYLVFINVYATWLHSNFGPEVKWLEKYLVLPRYHHWHHSSKKEAIDKNFAFHFPWIDKLLGTYYCPDEWPKKYGLDNEEIAPDFIRQTVDPFFHSNKSKVDKRTA